MNDINNNNSSSVDGGESSYEGDYGGSVLDSGAPAVASSPGKFFIVIGSILALLGLIVYIIFGDDEKSPEDMVENVATISQARDFSQPPPPPPPPEQPIPRLNNNVPDIAPPPVPEFPVIDQVDEADDEVRQERLRSGMMVLTGGKKSKSSGDVDEEGFLNSDGAPKVKASVMKNLNSTIAQGKIIFAVLESAIDTELQGMIRAIVSRDIYPEAGNIPMIPKGSRLVGIYNTDLFNGQKRAFVLWSRVIRPDGVSVMINSEASDMLGRVGIKGFVDNHYAEMFSSAVLTSVFSIGLAAVTEEITDVGNSTTTSNSDGSTTRNTSPTSDATLQALGVMSNTAQSIVNDMLDVRKTIVADQGTRINIMVNRDLVFPPEVNRQIQIIK